MMNYYNGFDALDRDEYEELMSDLHDEKVMQEEIADEAANDYFLNEIAADAAAHATDRYQLITVYEDISSKSESCNDFSALLRATEIYIMDPTCISVFIYDWQAQKEILNWSR